MSPKHERVPVLDFVIEGLVTAVLWDEYPPHCLTGIVILFSKEELHVLLYIHGRGCVFEGVAILGDPFSSGVVFADHELCGTYCSSSWTKTNQVNSTVTLLQYNIKQSQDLSSCCQLGI